MIRLGADDLEIKSPGMLLLEFSLNSVTENKIFIKNEDWIFLPLVYETEVIPQRQQDTSNREDP